METIIIKLIQYVKDQNSVMVRNLGSVAELAYFLGPALAFIKCLSCTNNIRSLSFLRCKVGIIIREYMEIVFSKN